MSNLVFLAVLPGILILYYIFRKDKVEREPVKLIVIMVILGAVSCIPAGILETSAEKFFPAYGEGTIQYALTISFLSAGLMEEVCKYIMLRFGIWRNKEFDYRFDGIVYGVSVAVGFALLENIMYVMDGGLSVAITRAFLSVPLHSFCGVFMGAFFGMAKLASVREQVGKSLGLRVMAVVVPIIIHGIYDTFAFWRNDYAYIMLLVYTAILYVIAFIIVRNFSRDDWKMAFYSRTDSYGSEGRYSSDYDRAGHGSSDYSGTENRYGSGGNYGGSSYSYGGSYQNNCGSNYDSGYGSSVENHRSWEDINPYTRYEDNRRVGNVSGFSIAGLVLALVNLISLTVFVIPGILAIIFSIIGLRRSPESGRGVAKVGLVLGIISMLISVLLYTYAV